MKKIFIAILLCAVLTGCGESSSVIQNPENSESQNIQNTESQDTEDIEWPVSQSTVDIENTGNKHEVVIEKTNAELLEEHMVNYNHQDIFSVTAPGTWEVSTGSYDMFYWIHLYDPNNENLQVFTLIEATAILKNQDAKDYYQYVLNATGNSAVFGTSANAIVLEPATTENFYQHFMDYCSFVSTNEPTYADFYFPQITNFETIEAFDIDDIYTPVALDNKLLHASFDHPLTMEKGEGLFTAAVTEGLVMTDPGYDCGYYNIYNVTGISAPYGMLNEYEDILRRIVGSIQYSDTFIETCSRNQGNIMQSASYVNQIMQDTSNIITEGWNQRQRSYDVISQKYSDAILGYERVRDIHDPEKIYRAYNGFMDSEDAAGFEYVTDDDYSKVVSGYINQ